MVSGGAMAAIYAHPSALLIRIIAIGLCHYIVGSSEQSDAD
jgi:hypothetical protein